LAARAYFDGNDGGDDFDDEEICSDFFTPKGKLNQAKNNKRRDVGHELVFN
jgi:hypothetical protein